jgi:GNAT superfamily N-acetyltransferase
VAPSDDVHTTTTTTVAVDQVDPRDERALLRWFEVVRAAEEHDRPGEPGELLHEQRQLALDGGGPDPDTAVVLLAASVAGDVVGAARLELPRRDNLHLCELVLCVRPAARRQGVARALQTEIERCVSGRGRSTLLTFADELPGSEGRSGSRSAARALGYAVAQQEVRRDIDVPLDPARVAELERACRPYAADYVLRTWCDACPDDLLGDLAELHRQMSTDVPKDEMDWREEVWDAARVRRGEELARSADRTFVGAGAVHAPSGRMVAFTAAGLPRSEPARAHQWETLVQAEHRGHRLGTLIKLAALQELAVRSPRTRFISTWNAQENEPMIAVNDALGARTNGVLAILQKVLTDS